MDEHGFGDSHRFTPEAYADAEEACAEGLCDDLECQRCNPPEEDDPMSEFANALCVFDADLQKALEPLAIAIPPKMLEAIREQVNLAAVMMAAKVASQVANQEVDKS